MKMSDKVTYTFFLQIHIITPIVLDLFRQGENLAYYIPSLQTFYFPLHLSNVSNLHNDLLYFKFSSSP